MKFRRRHPDCHITHRHAVAKSVGATRLYIYFCSSVPVSFISIPHVSAMPQPSHP